MNNEKNAKQTQYKYIALVVKGKPWVCWYKGRKIDALRQKWDGNG